MKAGSHYFVVVNKERVHVDVDMTFKGNHSKQEMVTTDTVEDLKKLLQETEKVEHWKIKLLYNDEEIANDQSLEDVK